MNKINIVFLLSILSFFINCKNNEVKINIINYKNGKIAQERKKLNTTDFYIKNYFKSGEIQSEGEISGSKKVGWWTIYNQNKITDKLNFMVISGKEYLNQKIKYDSNGSIINSESNYFTFKIPDTLKVGKTKIDIIYNPTFSDKSEVFVCIGYAINKDFNNINNVRIDSFYIPNLKKGWFGLRYESSGKKTIRGFIYEKNIILKDNLGIEKDSAIAIINDRTSYFEKEVYVKNK